MFFDVEEIGQIKLWNNRLERLNTESICNNEVGCYSKQGWTRVNSFAPLSHLNGNPLFSYQSAG